MLFIHKMMLRNAHAHSSQYADKKSGMRQVFFFVMKLFKMMIPPPPPPDWGKKNIIFVLNFMFSLRNNPESNQDWRHQTEEFLILHQTGQMAP